MGGKSSKPIIGYWYRPAYHHGLTTGLIDAFLEFRGGDKTAWQGVLTASGTIHINAPNLWGGEKDQGGIVGDVDVMFGEPTQLPNAYLVSVFGNQTAAWRGFSTVAFKGGRYGAMNPYPQKASYKIRRILQGWDGGACWYPDTAQIVLASGESAALIERFDSGDLVGYEVLEGINSGFSIVTEDGGFVLQTGQAIGDGHNVIGRPLPVVAALYRIRVRFKLKAINDDDAGGFTVRDGAGDVVVTFGSCRGAAVDALRRPSVSFRDQPGAPGNAIGSGPVAVDQWYQFDATYDPVGLRFRCSVRGDADGAVFGEIDIPVTARADIAYLAWMVDDFGDGGVGAGVTVWTDAEIIVGNVSGAINPAHVLYESRTNADMGREPSANINDASLRAAADKLFAEGFGICPKWDPSAESVEDFEQRICKLIGGSFTRSLEDGQWYLDLARGDYVLEDLPILTDDDILEFKEQPSTLDSAINSVSVRYFDPERKETIVTPPVRALGLVTAFGTIHQTYDCPEIPNAALAMRVAQMRMMATSTPTRAFDLVTTRRTYAWRPNQYFRLQLPKRGIADMVCIVGEKQSGSLKSGAIRMKATQDIYSLPSTSFASVEPGVDTRPPQTPGAITLQRAFEAPYIEVAAAMSRADLAALPAYVGYAMAVAAPPGSELDYTMMVAPSGGSYADAGRGEWCATATVVEAAPLVDPLPTQFTLADGVRLDQVTVGMAALWDDEIVRVDAIDAAAGTITLGRGCADTVAAGHAAGARLWFWQTGAAHDTTEYTDAETVDVKLLSNTGSQQLPEASATAMALTFDQRQYRPYPPGHFQLNGEDYPVRLYGDITITWAHRDRVLQADQLLDTSAASVGPESGCTYQADCYLNGILESSASGIAETSTFWTPSGSGPARVELWSSRGSLASMQKHVHEFVVGDPLWTPSSLAAIPKLWLNDDSAVTDAGAGACSQWDDISGNGYHVVQTAAGSRPLIVPGAMNGRRVLRFDGANDNLRSASAGAVLGLFRNVGSAWVFCTYSKIADASDAWRVIFKAQNGSGGIAERVTLATGRGAAGGKNLPYAAGRRLDADSAVGAVAPSAETGAVMLLGLLDFTNRTVTLWIDGNQVAQVTGAWTAGGNTSDTPSAFAHAIGSGQSGSGVPADFFNGDIAELVIGAGGLPSSTEIDRMFGYAAYRWGLQGNLDAGHPYKTDPPQL